MKDKKLQVFVSSNYTNISQERQVDVEAILYTGNILVGMEFFAAKEVCVLRNQSRNVDGVCMIIKKYFS